MKLNLRKLLRAEEYHKFVSFLGIVLAALLALYICVVTVVSEEARHDPGLKTLAALAGAAMGGYVIGVITACTFAPRGFFSQPSAKKFVDLIGTSHPVVARALCAIVLAGILTGLAFLVPLILKYPSRFLQ